MAQKRKTATGASLAKTLLARIAARKAKIGIIGLGYVGLPLACLFAEKGFSVTGFDVDAGKAEKLNAGRSYIRHIPGRRIAPLGQGPARRHGPGLHPSRLDPRAMAAARRARGDSGAGPEEAFDEDE